MTSRYGSVLSEGREGRRSWRLRLSGALRTVLILAVLFVAAALSGFIAGYLFG